MKMNSPFGSLLTDSLRGTLDTLDKVTKAKARFTGLLSRKAGYGLSKYFVLLYRIVQVKAVTKSNVRVSRLMAKRFWNIYKGNGIMYLVRYLKTCSVVFQQYVSGTRIVTDTRQISGVAIALTKGGLPAIIPPLSRLEIRRSNPKTIRFWLSLFNLYRYLNAPCGRPSVETILYGSGLPISEVLIREMAAFGLTFLARLGAFFYKMPVLSEYEFLFYPTTKVSSVLNPAEKLAGLTASSWRSLIKAVTALLRRDCAFLGRDLTPMREDLNAWAELINSPFKVVAEMLLPKRPWSARIPNIFKNLNVPIGKLAKIPEAAGKVRVIATVDFITQLLMRPLHMFLCDILRVLPQDGTFNQDKPLKLLYEKLKSLKGVRYVACYDLTAATDCLPIALQERVLGWFIGIDNAKRWARIMVNRDFKEDITEAGSVRYGVGQPMGILSSWAMLALTHHVIVQYSAMLVGYKTWFKDYALLGDDIAIGCKSVAEKYLSIMQSLGVKIGLAKSLISTKACLEFAKRFYNARGDCSPVSLGELSMAHEFSPILMAMSKKWNWNLATWLAASGYSGKSIGMMNRGIHKLPRRFAHIIIAYLTPTGPQIYDIEAWRKFFRSVSVYKSVNSNYDYTNQALELLGSVWKLTSSNTHQWSELEKAQPVGLDSEDKKKLSFISYSNLWVFDFIQHLYVEMIENLSESRLPSQKGLWRLLADMLNNFSDSKTTNSLKYFRNLWGLLRPLVKDCIDHREWKVWLDDKKVTRCLSIPVGVSISEDQFLAWWVEFLRLRKELFLLQRDPANQLYFTETQLEDILGMVKVYNRYAPHSIRPAKRRANFIKKRMQKSFGKYVEPGTSLRILRGGSQGSSNGRQSNRKG